MLWSVAEDSRWYLLKDLPIWRLVCNLFCDVEVSSCVLTFRLFTEGVFLIMIELSCFFSTLQAYEALNQLHRMDRANRKQYYDLHHLESVKVDEKSNARTAVSLFGSIQTHSIHFISSTTVLTWPSAIWSGNKSALDLFLFIRYFEKLKNDTSTNFT